MLCNFLGVAGLAGIFIMVFSMPLNTQLTGTVYFFLAHVFLF